MHEDIVMRGKNTTSDSDHLSIIGILTGPGNVLDHAKASWQPRWAARKARKSRPKVSAPTHCASRVVSYLGIWTSPISNTYLLLWKEGGLDNVYVR
jgi:hypothetical protein